MAFFFYSFSFMLGFLYCKSTLNNDLFVSVWMCVFLLTWLVVAFLSSSHTYYIIIIIIFVVFYLSLSILNTQFQITYPHARAPARLKLKKCIYLLQTFLFFLSFFYFLKRFCLHNCVFLFFSLSFFFLLLIIKSESSSWLLL